MLVRTYPAMNVLYSTFKTSLTTLHDKIGTVARDLYAEAARQHLLVTGPVYWLYYGADGLPDTIFTLEIAIPVSGIPLTDEKFLFKELPPFQCLSVLHEGAWTNLKHTYAQLLDKVQGDKLSMNGICREIYINVDFSRDECNLTEVQLGLA
jgi:effector-binding domain-containing protein